MTNDMIPVARTSFCIQAYQAAHNLSATFRLALYLPISSNWPQYVPEDKTVEFLYGMLDTMTGRGCEHPTLQRLFSFSESKEKAEVRRQKSEGRRQEAEVRGQQSERIKGKVDVKPKPERDSM